MNAEGRHVFVALVACIGFYFIYNRYMESRYPDYMGQQTAPVTVPGSNPAEQPEAPQAATAQGDAEISAPSQEVQRLSEDDLVFENDDVIFRFNQDMSALASVRLKNYNVDAKGQGGLVELLSSPLVVQGFTDSVQGEPLKSGYSAKREGSTFTFWREKGPWRYTQTFTMPDKGYSPTIEVAFENRSGESVDLQAGVFVFESIHLPASSSGFFSGFSGQQRSLIASVDGGRESKDAKEYCDDEETRKSAVLQGQSANIDYIGFDDHYFIETVLPEVKSLNYAVKYLPQQPATDGCPMLITLQQPQGLVTPGQKVEIKFRSYLGPKDLETLRSYDERLTSALDLGWFGIIARPLLAALKGLYQLVHNYGFAIIIITILLKILFYPLTRVAAVSMKRMQKLQPQMNLIRERFKDDPKRQQQEIMKFMATNKINPAKGCLPVLATIPVFVAFYNVLSHAIELRHAPFAGWLQDLAAPDPYYISPLLLGVGMFLQQKLTPNPGMDPAQQRIMMMMPLLFTVMMLQLPAGLVLYMIVNTAISIAQQQWLNRKLA